MHRVHKILGIAVFVLAGAIAPPFTNPSPVNAGECMIRPNCVYDLDTDEGKSNALVYGENVKFVVCFNVARRTLLEVKENGKWVTVSKSKVTSNAKKCGSKKFRYRNVFQWQVDVLPPNNENLQIRMRDGSWKSSWTQPIYASEQEVLDSYQFGWWCAGQILLGKSCT